MEKTPVTMGEVMEKLGQKIERATPEQKEKIKVFLEGYTAGLEHLMSRAEK